MEKSISMNQCCFICNNRAGLSLRNATSLFGDYNTLSSGKKVSEVVSEILEKPIQEDKVHTSILCKKCHKTCSEYDCIQVRLKAIKSELLGQFKLSLSSNNLNYDKYQKSPQDSSPQPKVPKKIVLPASKLQPIPPDLLLKVGKLAPFSKSNLASPQFKPITTSSLNLKVTVGSSVLTETIKTATPKPETTTIDTNTILTSLAHTKHGTDNITTTQSNIIDKNTILSFNVDAVPKDFLGGAILTKMSDENDKVYETHDDHPMEIDEDCISVVPVTTEDGDNLVLQVGAIQSKSQTSEVSEYLNLPSLEGADGEESDAQKYILGKLQILNEDDDDDDEEGHTIVVEGEEGSILRMVSGQKFIYEGGDISLVLPRGDRHTDAQDSNDESQIELQVSGDEETANAIIAAAQEQGGAFIKVESGEMYRVQSVSSADEVPQQIVKYDGEQFTCLLCEKNEGASFSGGAEASMRHVRAAHGARLYLCACGRAHSRRADYAAHLGSHAQAPKPAAHRCAECGKALGSRALLREHANVHSGARPHVCAHCGKAFANKYTHQAHLKTHAVRPRPFKCTQCGKSFLTQQNLNQHEKTHSGIKDFVCGICNKAFSTQHNLEVHGVVHSRRKAFVCALCGKPFARRAELRDHTRIHTGERPFSCDICGARFTQRSNLHSHRRATHFDDKRHHCTQCPKKFKRRRLLEYHIKATHTGERPLKCGICDLSFVYPEHYKKHIRIHSGERPYVCEICGKSFNSRDNRNTHRFVHSDKKPYECVTCGAGYMRKQLLYAHMNTSGHLAETIVVNQPRVIKVTEDASNSQSSDASNTESKSNKFETIFEDNELQTSMKTILKAETGVNLEEAKLYITDDKKLILQDTDKSTLNLIQEADESTLLTIQAVDAHQLEGQTEIVANDENGSMVRLIQIKLPDGNDGWVAINP